MQWNEMNSRQRLAFGWSFAAIMAVVGVLLWPQPLRPNKYQEPAPIDVVETVVAKQEPTAIPNKARPVEEPRRKRKKYRTRKAAPVPVIIKKKAVPAPTVRVTAPQHGIMQRGDYP